MNNERRKERKRNKQIRMRSGNRTKHDGTCGGMAIALCGAIATTLFFIYLDTPP